jgi:hypothetical protein
MQARNYRLLAHMPTGSGDVRLSVSAPAAPFRIIKAFPEFSIDRTNVIFAGRSTPSLSGDQ